MVKLEISQIIIDEGKSEQVIVLNECDGPRRLPIVLGSAEAYAIRAHLSGVITRRPLTHDLMYSFLNTMEIELEKVIIDKLVDNTFHAKIYLITKDDTLKVVDARPSDGIALAVRTSSPIFAEESIFDQLSKKAQ
ncbi:MAG: bifunctional nuclease family protein [Candidatus Omnitrophica bacterium]|nr:bifunctional nuclease family protein [Candidatus Omnitrophota bacterium]